MSTTEARELVAGRETDREIHGRVLRLATLRNMAGYENIPPYSTEIAAAWEVVEKLGYRAVITRCEDGGGLCELQDSEWRLVAGAAGKTVPLAICRAALKALG